MYWLDMSKLPEDLREGRVDEKEQFKYYLGTLLLWILFSHLLFDFRIPVKIEYLIFSAINLTVVVIGVVVCYWANKRGDNKDFASRMICLGWSVGVWFVLIFLIFPLFIAFFKALLIRSPDGLPSETSGLASLLLKFWEYLREESGSILEEAAIPYYFGFIYFYCLYRQVTLVARPKEVQSAIPAQETDWSFGEGERWAFAAAAGLGLLIVIHVCHWISHLDLSKPLDAYLRAFVWLVFIFALGWTLERWDRNIRS